MCGRPRRPRGRRRGRRRERSAQDAVRAGLRHTQAAVALSKRERRRSAVEGVASPDYLWWPPREASGSFLAPFLKAEPSD
jgi:hypothetical protein